METKKALLLLNGNYNDTNFYKKALNDYDLTVCADGAGNFLYKINQVPDILLGDLDSISSEALEYFKNENVPTKLFPAEKNYTDSQLGILKIKELGYTKIDIFGGFGSRIDHTLGNIGLIYSGHKKGLKIRLIDENNVLSGLEKGETEIEYRKDKVFSIIATFENLEGLSINKAKYLLDKYNMEKGEPRGISNEFIQENPIITLKKGFGLLCISTKI